jgi:hypothetical protein
MIAASLDLEDLALDRGGYLLLRRALATVAPGGTLHVRGRASALKIHLGAFCRNEGHTVSDGPPTFVAAIVRGSADEARWRGAERAGAATATVDHPPAAWGVAGRGALVEPGGPSFPFFLDDKNAVWTDEAPRLYAQAAAAQWDPATAIPWSTPLGHPPEIEAAVVQVMTYLVENETAALLLPARFLAQIHPHFREVMQVLAVQVADEARHVEVFTRRAQLGGGALGVSTVAGRASLRSLFDEPDFAQASFLLSVLGEGSFLSLLRFLERHAPDAVTAAVVRLAAQDEGRHVAFGLGHLERHLAREPGLRGRLASAVERRHAGLRHTAGLAPEVMEALVVLAAGSWAPAAIGRGFDRVLALQADMDEGRQQRLRRLGFASAEAEALSALHTRNFM